MSHSVALQPSVDLFASFAFGETGTIEPSSGVASALPAFSSVFDSEVFLSSGNAIGSLALKNSEESDNSALFVLSAVLTVSDEISASVVLSRSLSLASAPLRASLDFAQSSAPSANSANYSASRSAAVSAVPPHSLPLFRSDWVHSGRLGGSGNPAGTAQFSLTSPFTRSVSFQVSLNFSFSILSPPAAAEDSGTPGSLTAVIAVVAAIVACAVIGVVLFLVLHRRRQVLFTQSDSTSQDSIWQAGNEVHEENVGFEAISSDIATFADVVTYAGADPGGLGMDAAEANFCLI
jgi:hypothetical protein